MLTLTRDEWDRIAADGRGVLFREASRCECRNGLHEQGRCAAAWPEVPGDRQYPPAEFMEAAQACLHDRYDDADLRTTCEDCIDGKRRIAAVVPCPFPLHKSDVRHHIAHAPCGCFNGFVTVGHVVRTWGPLVAQDEDCPDEPDGGFVVIYSDDEGEAWLPNVPDDPDLRWRTVEFTLPPGVDPQPLIGKYALGVEVVS